MNSEIQNPKSELKDTRLIREITLRNILSFGPDTPPLELRPLNVLIGANGSGKSNLMIAIGLMRDTTKDKSTALQNAGGSLDLIWKGKTEDSASIQMNIDLGVFNHVSHLLQFSKPRSSSDIRIQDEEIKEAVGQQKPEGKIYYNRDLTKLTVKLSNSNLPPDLVTGEIDFSALDRPEIWTKNPELFMLNDAYRSMRIFRNWDFTDLRSPQPADSRGDELSEDMSNYLMYLSRIIVIPEVKRKIIDAMNELFEGMNDITILTQFGHVQLYLTEGNLSVPATRLSDGTLRYLTLLTILLDPDPPPLICIDEPELGLHPDVLIRLANHLINASKRTQIIVSTHSEILVDAMTENPEDVIVFDKHDGQTEMTRYDKDDLKDWLEDFRLGRLWAKGVIGGNRW